MKLTYSLDPAERLGLLVLTGGSNPNGWTAGAIRMADDPGFGGGYRLIVDARQTAPFDQPFMAQFAGWLDDLRRRFADLRWAIVTPSGAAFGAAHELTLRADSRGIDIEVFTDLTESLRWLRSDLAA